jgi:hypothetical protein
MGMIHYNRQETRKRLMAGEIPAWVSNSHRKDYIIRIVLSILPWVDQKQLLALNAEAARITKLTGIEHHLDHIVPVSHPLVCGLTVPWNLRVMPYRSNLAKSNFWCPDQQSLFGDEHTEEEALQEYLAQFEEDLTNEETGDTIASL